MINIRQTISKLATINNEFNVPFPAVEDAIKMLEMWKWIREQSVLYDDPTIREAEEKFFPKPKVKTRVEKFNKIIQEVYNSYVYANEKVNEERESIITMLVKLRDEEEDMYG